MARHGLTFARSDYLGLAQNGPAQSIMSVAFRQTYLGAWVTAFKFRRVRTMN
jgi:hypothetical protein